MNNPFCDLPYWYFINGELEDIRRDYYDEDANLELEVK